MSAVVVPSVRGAPGTAPTAIAVPSGAAARPRRSASKVPETFVQDSPSVEVTNCADVPGLDEGCLVTAPMKPCGPTVTNDGAGSAARTQVLPSDETQTAGTDTPSSFGIGAA